MMSRALSIALLLLTASLALGDTPRTSISKIGVLPNQKAPIVLSPRDRNPFVGKEAKTIETAPEDRVSEESVLRAYLNRMSVTGLILSEGGNKALLERLILEEGRELPMLMKGQTERLIVGKIQKELVEIFFVESDDRIEPRKITIPIKITPKVTQRWFATDALPEPQAQKN